jgi:hypothetical protein
VKLRYNSAKESVKQKENVIKNYLNNFNDVQAVNSQCKQEDKEFKEVVYKKAKKLEKIQKEKIQDKNKYGSTLKPETIGIFYLKVLVSQKPSLGTTLRSENFMNSTYGSNFVNGNSSNRNKDTINVDRSGSLERNPLIEKFEKENKLVKEII